MIDFVVSVQLEFFDFVISDFPTGYFVFCKSNPAQCLTNGNHIFRCLPIDLYLFFFQIAEKVFAVIRYKRFKSKVFFLRYSRGHNKRGIRRVDKIVSHLHPVADM